MPAIDVHFMKLGGNDRVLTSGRAKRRNEDRRLFVHWPGLIWKVYRRSEFLESVVEGAVVVLAKHN